MDGSEAAAKLRFDSQNTHGVSRILLSERQSEPLGQEGHLETGTADLLGISRGLGSSRMKRDAQLFAR